MSKIGARFAAVASGLALAVVLGPALVPFSSITGEPVKPGCVVPSMVTAPVIVGRAESGDMVCTPEPGMLKVIVSVPVISFASSIACRNNPTPLSFVLVTVNVCPAGLNT